jgi:sugar lactone lactonase YvrE
MCSMRKDACGPQFHGIGKVLRISPQGEILAEVKIPTRCPSCPTVAGGHLFVTSAQEDDPDQYPDSTEFEGSLFKVDIGVKGLPAHKFRMQV